MKDLLEKSCIKIMHFTSSNGLFGAEKIIFSLASSMNCNGVISIIGAVKNTYNPHIEFITEAARSNLPTIIFESSRKIDLSLVWKLACFLKKEKIDILHTHNYKSNIIGLLSAKFAGIPIISTVHGYTSATFMLNFYEKIDKFFLNKFFDKVVAVDDSIAQHFSTRKVSVIDNGIALENFIQNSDRNSNHLFNFNKDDFVIGTVGRLSAEKNHSLFISAARKLINLYPHLKFIIIGDGPLEHSLKSYVRKLKLENKIIFTGIQTDMKAVYGLMDIFVLTSTTEGQPLTILEAFSAKVPVIASRVGGIPNLVMNEQTGILFDSGNLGGLVKAISYLIENPQKKESLKKNAYEFVKNKFTAKQMTNRYKDIYYEMLKEKRSI